MNCWSYFVIIKTSKASLWLKWISKVFEYDCWGLACIWTSNKCSKLRKFQFSQHRSRRCISQQFFYLLQNLINVCSFRWEKLSVTRRDGTSDGLTWACWGTRRASLPRKTARKEPRSPCGFAGDAQAFSQTSHLVPSTNLNSAAWKVRHRKWSKCMVHSVRLGFRLRLSLSLNDRMTKQSPNYHLAGKVWLTLSKCNKWEFGNCFV